MTPTSELIAKLDELSGKRDNVLVAHWLEEAAQRLREMEEALRPFAVEAGAWPSGIVDDELPLIGHPADVSCPDCDNANIDGVEDAKFTVGNLRRAAALVSP